MSHSPSSKCLGAVHTETDMQSEFQGQEITELKLLCGAQVCEERM